MTRAALPVRYANYLPPDAGSLFDCSTAATFTEITANSTKTTDTTVTWEGRNTVRIDVAAGAAANVEIGFSAATLSLGWDAQSLLSEGPVFVTKTDLSTMTGVTLYVGDASYTNFRTYSLSTRKYTDADGWDVYSRNASIAGTVADTGTPPRVGSVRAKIRFIRSGAGAGTIWLAWAGIAPKIRAKVVLTVDDGYDEWYSYLYPAAKAAGIPVTMCVSSSFVDTAGYITTAQMQEMAADASGLFQIANHAVENVDYGTKGIAAYMADLETCRQFLVARGIPAEDALFHPYVNGTYDATLVAAMTAAGYKSARGAGDYGAFPTNPWHSGYDRTQIMQIPIGASLTDTTSLATVKTALTTATKQGASMFIMGHRFEGTAGTLTWIAGSDATNGMTDLLADLAARQARAEIDCMTWRDWHDGLSGARSDSASRVAAASRAAAASRIAA